MRRTFKMLFILFLGTLFFILTFTISCSAENTNQDKLIELKDIYVKGGIPEAEYKAVKKILTSKEDKSDKKIKTFHV